MLPIVAAAIEGITVIELIPTNDDIYVIPAKSFGSNVAAITPTNPFAITGPYPRWWFINQVSETPIKEQSKMYKDLLLILI